jgi:long-chain acyl-CoA synthetase
MPALHGPPLRSRFASIPAALGHWAARTPHAPALTSPGTTQTYAELAAAVRGFRLVGDTGRDVPPGEVGEVWASGPTRMRGYWGLPAATSAAICDGCLRTGDLACCDGGLLYLCGRTDDVINRGGEKILPKDVETEIAALPGVGQVCVFGAPDHVLQQRVVAVIEPRPGVTFDAGHARATLAGHLPDYAVPEHFFVADNLPRTASGKLDRRLITAGHGRKRTPHITESS